MLSETDIKENTKALHQGSYNAFEKLYEQYCGKLYNFIMRLSSGNQYIAEEVVQTTFIRIWEARETINPEQSFISFLCTIAKNLLMNMYQRQTVEFVYSEYVQQSMADYTLQTEDETNLRFLNEYIDKLTENLPSQRKKIFVLSKRKNYSNKEIAQMMNISESTVATQLSLAVSYIRDQLLKHYDTIMTLLFAFFVNKYK
jgi:RNA polymerase sigma-70 factor (family 1)